MDQVRVATLAPWVLTPLHIWVEAKQASLLLAEVLRMRGQTWVLEVESLCMGELLTGAAGEFRWAKGICGNSSVCYTPLDSSKTFISRSQIPLASSWLTVPVACSSGLSCDCTVLASLSNYSSSISLISSSQMGGTPSISLFFLAHTQVHQHLMWCAI